MKYKIYSTEFAEIEKTARDTASVDRLTLKISINTLSRESKLIRDLLRKSHAGDFDATVKNDSVAKPGQNSGNPNVVVYVRKD